MSGANETSPLSRLLRAVSRRPWNVILRVLQIVFLIPILWAGVGGYTMIVAFENYMADVPGPFLWAAILVGLPLIASQIGAWLAHGDRRVKTRHICQSVRRFFRRAAYVLIAIGFIVILQIDILVEHGTVWTPPLAAAAALWLGVTFLLRRSRAAVRA